jgi:hypothetical protein
MVYVPTARLGPNEQLPVTPDALVKVATQAAACDEPPCGVADTCTESPLGGATDPDVLTAREMVATPPAVTGAGCVMVVIVGAGSTNSDWVALVALA